MRQRRTLLPFCLAICLAVGLAAPVAWAAEVNINVTGTSFSPRNVTIQVGDTVTWTNNGQGFHNVVSDDAGFRSGAPSDEWTFSHTFNSAGSFGFYCEPHQSFGMTGTVTVQDDGGGGEDDPGTLRFSLTSYTVSEGAGTATITVNRVNGDDGAASVQWTATAGTATAGSDFTAASGTLNWANSDDANKTFQITIVNDTADESNETINLALSNATGAALDNTRRTATLTITDNDDGGGGGNAPAVPTNLRADAQSTTEIRLDWTDAANNETGFRIERRTLTGTFQEIGTVGANTTSFVAGGLSSGTFYVFRVRAQNSAGNSAFSNEAGAAPNEAALPRLGHGALRQQQPFPGRSAVADIRWQQRSGTGRAHPLGAGFGPVLLLLAIQPGDAPQGAQRVWSQQSLLGVLRRHHQRGIRRDGHRHAERPGEELLQPPGPAGATHPGHRCVRDLPVKEQLVGSRSPSSCSSPGADR